MKKVNLFCFPYAGSSAMIYSKWKKDIHEQINLVPVELAGRGGRIEDEPYTSIRDAANDAYHQIQSYLNQGPFTFFGHSMGSLVAYELAHEVLEKKGLQPEHIFFSGRRAPQCPNQGLPKHLLPETAFKKELSLMGGTPSEVLENKELSDLFLPLIRNDYKIVETYEYKKKVTDLKCDISVFYGKTDEISYSELMGWEEHSSGRCELIEFEGGHFFINEQMKELLRVVNNKIDLILK
ncbi:thioesterase II family protein [Paenibacillus sp. SAF-068]|uniref:thioesterase II family protein n=1 Tax=Paenibacillus sp. SAF-068 TaxID=3436864 RepID=UPI003F7DDC5B